MSSDRHHSQRRLADRPGPSSVSGGLSAAVAGGIGRPQRTEVADGGERRILDVAVSVISHSDREGILACLSALSADAPNRTSAVGVTVLDTASRDGSVDAIRLQFPDVHVIEGPCRRGFAANHNTVVRATQSRYVLLLNDDVRVGAGMIDTLVTFLDAHPRAGAAGPKVLSPSGGQTESAWRLPSLPVLLRFAVTLGRSRSVQSRGRFPRRVEHASACALMLRRYALEEVGLLDESFFMYVEDADLCKRLGDASYEVWYVPMARVLHLGGRSTSTDRARRISEEWRSRRTYWTKHHGTVKARLASLLRGAPYAVGFVLVRVSHVMPRPVRTRLSRWPADELMLQARSAWLGADEPGLSEAARDWNASRGPGSRDRTESRG